MTLEGEVRLPDQDPRGSAVLCHPHPLQGGSKDHPLLWAVRIELARIGLLVLSFNFRGVMGSEGRFGGGLAEVADARAAVGTARERDESGGPTLLVGWSFGAHVALREAIEDQRVQAIALIGFPLNRAGVDLPPLPQLPDPGRLRAYARPVLLLAGSEDQFCPAQDLREFARRLPLGSVTILAGADHYFGKRERDAARVVAAFGEQVLFRPGTAN